MSSTQKEPKSGGTDKSTGVNSDMDVDDSVVNKTIETTDKSGVSSPSVEKNVAKRKRVKSSTSHKKIKKDPNKPEYPKVGMCIELEYSQFFF